MTDPWPNVAVVTFDSLRYDAAIAADVPALRDLGLERWRRARAHGTFTLPAHVAMLGAGRFPGTDGDPGGRCLLRLGGSVGAGHADALIETPEAPTLVAGFRAAGYRTVGVGGTDWFDPGRPASRFWSDWFDHYAWDPLFADGTFDGVCLQAARLRNTLAWCGRHDEAGRLTFIFWNIAATHGPYLGEEASVAGQARALEKVDKVVATTLDYLPRPLLAILTADHGECFGEDGLWGHGHCHPRVMEVPLAVLRLGGP